MVHPLRPRLDHLGERILSRDALVDRQPAPRGSTLVERVCDVLAGHWLMRSGGIPLVPGGLKSASKRHARERLPASPGVYLFKDAEGDARLRRQGQVAAAARALSISRQGARHAAAIDLPRGADRRHRDDRHRQRGRGPAPRAEPDQAPPAGLQRPAARRQVVPVHRGHGRGRLSARDVHARAARRGVAYFGPYANAKKVRETLDVLNRVFATGPAKGRSRAGTRDPVPRLPHRALPGAVRRRNLEGGRTGRSWSDASWSSSGRTQDECCASSRADARRRRRRALRGGGAYRNRDQVRHLAERLEAPRDHHHGHRGASTSSAIHVEGDRAAVQVFSAARREGWSTRTASWRTSTEPEPARSRTRCSEFYGRRRVVPRADRGAAGRSPDRECWRRGSPSGAGRRWRSALPQRGEKARLARARRAERADRARVGAVESEHPRLQPQEPRGAARGARPGGSSRSASSASTSPTSRARTSSARWWFSRTRCRRSRTTASSAIRGVGAPDDFASMAEVVTRRFARRRDVTAEQYDNSFAATPNLVVVDGGKGQLSAVLAAMQAFDLPRVAVISLAKREEEVFLPGRPEAGRPRPPLSRAPVAAADPRRSAPLRARLHRQRRDAAAKESTSTRSRVSARHDGAH